LANHSSALGPEPPEQHHKAENVEHDTVGGDGEGPEGNGGGGDEGPRGIGIGIGTGSSSSDQLPTPARLPQAVDVASTSMAVLDCLTPQSLSEP
jgi:hypothetical protein